MRIRAVIFDIYGTLLEVGPPPADAEARWQRLFADTLGSSPPCGRTEFSVQCSQAIARHHAQAKARGLGWPEVQWPNLLREVLPGLNRLEPTTFADFTFAQMQIGRTVRLARGAGDTLRWLRDHGVTLGIATNAQRYTVQELSMALAGDGLTMAIFAPELSFWSYQHGFSKPDPHVFQILTARLEQRGWAAGEALMVGDRWDNDMAPARLFGWQTWWLRGDHQAAPPIGGDHAQLVRWMAGRG